MIIVLKKGCKKRTVESIIKKVKELGFKAHAIFGVERTVIGAVCCSVSISRATAF